MKIVKTVQKELNWNDFTPAEEVTELFNRIKEANNLPFLEKYIIKEYMQNADNEITEEEINDILLADYDYFLFSVSFNDEAITELKEDIITQIDEITTILNTGNECGKYIEIRLLLDEVKQKVAMLKAVDN